MNIGNTTLEQITKRVFLTGATGFIGRHLLTTLLEQDRSVIALCRSKNSLREFKNPLLKVVEGSLEDYRSYESVLKDTKTVIHLAASRNTIGISLSDLLETNVKATLNLARSSQKAGIDKFIYISTALLHPRLDKPGNRNNIKLPDKLENNYLLSRRKVLDDLNSMVDIGFPLITISPTIVFGPDYPDHPNRITKHIRNLRRFRFDIVIRGGSNVRNLVYIDDVVYGIIEAEKYGKTGETYILGGEEISHRQLNMTVLKISGQKPLFSISVPEPVAIGTARVLDLFWGYEKGSGFEAAVNMLLTDWFFSTKKAKKDLNYTPLPISQAISRTITHINERH